MAAVLFIFGGFSMKFILSQLEYLGFDTPMFLRAAVLLTIGSIVLGAVGRFVFGKRSVLHCAISSAIGIVFIYVATVALQCYGTALHSLLAPLPFMELKDGAIQFFSFQNAEISAICTQVLSIVILAFLVNILDSILPRGKNFLVWLVLRIVTVAGAMVLHVVALWLLSLLPVDVMQYAPMVLLALVVLLVLVGGLKIIVGAVLTTVNPIIGILYTFFFANLVGKAITKAILTGGIMTALVYLLEYLGITSVPLLSEAMVLYVPFALILLLVWFVIGKLFDK